MLALRCPSGEGLRRTVRRHVPRHPWVLWDTGIRVGELCDLRRSKFDRRQGTLIVFGKGMKERRVALGLNAVRALLYYLDRWRQDAEELGAIGNPDEEHVFLSEGGEALTIHGIEMLFKRLRARTGVKGKRVSAHIFRHTFAATSCSEATSSACRRCWGTRISAPSRTTCT